MVEGRADMAVHSLKDMPMEMAEGFTIAAVPVREDPRDALVCNLWKSIEALPAGAVVGTSSLRREAQLRERNPGISVRVLRGNVNTRVHKLDEGKYDAMILAVAGLNRLEQGHRIAACLPPEEFLPAVGQGALALECRADDAATRALLAPIEDGDTAVAVAAERAFQAAIGGDCNTPLAAHATIVDGRVSLHGMVSDADGKRRLEDSATAPADDADGLGRRLAERLLARGARDILGR